MMLADKNFAKTLTSGIMARIGQLFRQNQSDWNMSDPDSPSYVKNRTHWAEPGQLVYLVDSVTIINGNTDGMMFDTFSLKVGQKYTVTFDGIEYGCVCFDDDGYPTIGDTEDNIFTNYPFFISSNPDWTFCSTVDDEEHSISLSTIEEKVHKIDEKYLPDVDYVGKHGTGEDAEIFNYDGNVARGAYSHAEGYNTRADSDSSHAEGAQTLAADYCAHTEGFWTIAQDSYAHAEGLATSANGEGSHAEGDTTTAAGSYSHAEGSHTIARGVNSHVQGKYNIDDTGKKYAHIVGNGTSTTRSNAHTLDWDGNAWFAGTVEGKAMIVDSATEGSTKKFRVDIDDTGAMKSSDAETGDVYSTSVPPSGGTPYQQLVTDGDGNARWEDRPFGVEKGAVIRSVSELSWSENTGYKKDEYQYKVDVDVNVFNTFDTIPGVDANSSIQVVVDGVVYSNMTVEYTNAGGAYEIHVYSEECPVYISTVNAYMADVLTVQFLSNRTDITSVKVIDLGKNSIKAMSSDYIEFASTTPGSTKKFKITVDDSGTISATEVTA